MASEYETFKTDEEEEQDPQMQLKKPKFKTRHSTVTVWRRRRSQDLKQKMENASFHEIYTGQLNSARD